MKALSSLLFCGVLAVGGWDLWRSACGGCSQPAASQDLGKSVEIQVQVWRAESIEARSAAVFAGACHYMGEGQTNGRDGVIGWRLEGDLERGVRVDGLCLAVAVSGPQNLADAGDRQSVLWIDSRASAQEARSLEGWVRREHGALLGDLVAVRRSPVVVERTGDRFHLRVPGAIEVQGQALADRACCSMPEWRCYEPLGGGRSGALVGNATTCSFEGAFGLPAWSYADGNNVHLATAKSAARSAGCCPPSRADLQP